MIVGERKPFDQIWNSIKGLKSVLVLGCGTCVAVCQSGGEKEVGLLASELRMKARLENNPIKIGEYTIERQCDKEFFEAVKEKIKDYEAILSMACGAGVQFSSDIFETTRVLPALNTRFIGVALGEGMWSEKCRACGSCIVGEYGGICPMTICAKSLVSGACGGSKNGKCEAGQDKDCAWVLIYNRLKKQNRLDVLKGLVAPKDNRTQAHPGTYNNEAYLDPTMAGAEEKHAK
ncbi:MAG TPA: methylenetetrahydrofolate reductase C-terminal domain-containing protein [Dehalococcoidales bacterium]|nr:methylenetetrahydrofolate reductase C-terminal domain-containing protein [Dehalococcoidales bacterium]